MDQPNTRLSIASGCFCILLGLIVVYGWNRQSLPVIQIHSSFAPMQYVTALGFLFCGISLVLSNFKKHFLACILGLLASLIGAVTLAQYICDVNTGLDELFIDPQVLANVSYPGRMAPNTALCFILSGLALSLRCLAQKIKNLLNQDRNLETLGFIVTGLALVSLLGYLFNLESAYGWGSLTGMAIHTAIGFLILGVGIIKVRGPKSYQSLALQFPVFLAIGLLMIAIIFWKSLLDEEEKNMRNLMQQEVEHIKSILNHSISQDILALERLKLRWEGRLYSEKNHWLQDAGSYARDKKELLAVEWVDENYIVRWVEPLVGNESVENLDLSLEENRKQILDLAKASGETQLTDIIELVQGGLGFISASPLFVDGKFEGFILGVFEIDEILAPYTASQMERGLTIQYFNLKSRPEGFNLNKLTKQQQYQAGVGYRGINFRMLVTFEDKFFSKEEFRFPHVIGPLGILLSIFFTLLVYFNRKLKFHSRNLEQLAYERNELNVELRKLYNRLEKIREEERIHIAREIHDELGQTLTAIKLDLTWLEKRITIQGIPIRDKLGAIYMHIQNALDTVRRVSTHLRPQVLDVMGFCEALQWQAETFRVNTNIQYTLTIEPEKISLPPEMSTDLFRIFQETLTNITRHAHASNVMISFVEDEDTYKLDVKDDGIGIDPAILENTSSLGLLGIRERALIWSGQVDIQSTEGGGTWLKIEFPKVNYDQ